MASAGELRGLRERWAELTRRAQPAATPYSDTLRGEVAALIDDVQEALGDLSAVERKKLEDSRTALNDGFAAAALAGVGAVLDHRGL